MCFYTIDDQKFENIIVETFFHITQVSCKQNDHNISSKAKNISNAEYAFYFFKNH